MSFKKGSVGFRIAYTSQPIDDFVSLAKEQQLPPLETISDTIAYGWSASDCPLDKNFSDEHCGNGRYYELGFVKTQKKIQSSTYKAYFQEQVNAYYNANGKYPKKDDLASIKDSVVSMLMPLTAPSFKVNPVLFDNLSQRVLISAMNENDTDNLQRGISFASGVSVVAADPIYLAIKKFSSKECTNWLDTVSVTDKNVEPFNEEHLGQYFLTWAFLKFCMAQEPFGVEVENDIVGKEKCFISFKEPFVLVDKTELSLKKGAPYQDVSFWSALNEGKRIKAAKIEIVSNTLKGSVSFTFNGDLFSFSGVKIPKLEKELIVDDMFSTRSKLFNMVADVMEGAYNEFLDVASDSVKRQKFKEECLAFIEQKM